MTSRTDRAGRSQSAGAEQTTALVATWSDDRRESDGCRERQVLGSACSIGSGPTCVPRDHRPAATWAPFPTAGCNPAGIAVWGGRRAVRFRGSPIFFAAATHTRSRSTLERVGSPVPSGGFSHASGGVLPGSFGVRAPSPSSQPRRLHFFDRRPRALREVTSEQVSGSGSSVTSRIGEIARSR